MSIIAQSSRHLIIGAGVTGRSIANFFDRKGLKYAMYDAKPIDRSSFRNVTEVYDDEVTLGFLKKFDVVYVSPGIDVTQKPYTDYILNGGKLGSDIDLFNDNFVGKVVAITGSNGKSTVTDMVAYALASLGYKAQACGNYGVPVLDVIEDTEIAVVELSSFQLERIAAFRSNVATILNLSPDHLDRHGTILNYHQAKMNIFKGAHTAVVNADDPLSKPYTIAEHQQVLFTLSQPDLGVYGLLEQRGVKYIAKGITLLANCADFKVFGEHNLANILASVALCDQLGIPNIEVLDALKSYRGLEHRSEFVAEVRGVEFINDSKATNIGATAAALGGAFTGTVHLLLGGDAKGATFEALNEVLGAHTRVYAYGRDAGRISSDLDTPVKRYDTLDAATIAAFSGSQQGDTILLSPACASFDQFKNYQVRGHHFKDLVKQLKNDNE